MKKLILATAALVFTATAAFATLQQGGTRCYERCTTDAAGNTHCVSWCQ